MSLNFRPESVKLKEDEFICKLLHSEKLYSFICYALFKIIQKAKGFGIKTQHIADILSSSIVKTKDAVLLQKPGYQCKKDPSFCKNAISTNTYGEFYKLNKENNISFLNLMGAFYKFQGDNTLAQYCIEHDPALQKKFMSSVKQYFSLPDSFTFPKVKKIIENSEGNWFYLFVLTYMSSDKHNFVRHHLLNQKDYIRGVSTEFQSLKGNATRKNVKAKKLKRSLTCKRKQLQNQPVTNIVRGNTYYTPTKNGIWLNFMKMFKKEVNSGPSGSSIITYQILFDVTKVLKPTRYNKVMLLLCILADYYYYYHTVSEVLQEYTAEAELPRYTLDMNDIQYVEKLVKQQNLKIV